MRAFGKFALAAAMVLATATATLAADVPIVLDKMHFGPIPADLHVGDTLVWQNHDIFRHSATARDKSFDIDLPPGAEVRMVLDKAGSVDFFCKFHPGMTGALVVAP
jgi:plastocyanin